MGESLPNNNNKEKAKMNRREFIRNALISSMIGATLGGIIRILTKEYLNIDIIKVYLNYLNNPKLKKEILELDADIKIHFEKHKKIYKKLNEEIEDIKKNINRIQMGNESESLNHLTYINKNLTYFLGIYESFDQQIEMKLKEIDSIKTSNPKEEKAKLEIYSYLLSQQMKIQEIKLLNANLQSQILEIQEKILQRRKNYMNKKLA
jgi:hypothetical protein